jgi:hypothetical protein
MLYMLPLISFQIVAAAVVAALMRLQLIVAAVPLLLAVLLLLVLSSSAVPSDVLIDCVIHPSTCVLVLRHHCDVLTHLLIIHCDLCKHFSLIIFGHRSEESCRRA